jgi:hypothetical protein
MQLTDSSQAGAEPSREGTAPSPALLAAGFRFSHIAELDGFRGPAVPVRYAPEAPVRLPARA